MGKCGGAIWWRGVIWAEGKSPGGEDVQEGVGVGPWGRGSHSGRSHLFLGRADCRVGGATWWRWGQPVGRDN